MALFQACFTAAATVTSISAQEEVECPLRVPIQQQERCFLIACYGAGQEDSVQSRLQVFRIEGGDKTVLKSCNFSTAWRRLFAPILVNNAWRALNAPVSKDCSLPSARFVLLGFPRKDNCRLSDVNNCLLTPVIPHNLGSGFVDLVWIKLSPLQRNKTAQPRHFHTDYK